MKKNRSDVAFADAEEQASSDRHQSRIPSGQGVRSIEKMDDLEPAERDAIREELCEHASDFPEEHIFKNTPALVAGSQASEAIDDATPQYEETEAGIFLIKQTSSGPERKQLTNFIPHISTEIVLDNGIEKQRQYEITVTLRGKTYQFVLSVEQFSAMNWPAKHLGVQAVVYAGAGTRDHARAAIQTLSHDVKRHTVYTYTGWREIDGRRVFLHGGGAIGRDGPVEGVEVDLPDELAAYVLPVVQDHDALIRSVLASLEIRKVAPEQITMPLLAAVHRSVLDHPCDASVFLVGPTGVGKSELAALANQHFGPGLDRVNLPANWSSTANALEAIAFAAKNVMLTIDDFAPSGSSGHVSELHQKADRVLRAQGNGAGRQRMGSDLKLKPTMSPGGVILATGEVLPRGESLRARMLVVTISPGDVDHKKLTQCQEDGREGAYATAMAGFAQYLAGDGQQAMATLDKRLATYREKAGSAHAHARTASIVANLYVGWELFTEFAQSIGAITEDERRDLLDRGWSAITRCAEKQSAFQQTQEPAHQFIRLIKNAITSGRAHLAGMAEGAPAEADAWGWRSTSTGMRAIGQCIGWVDDADVYLDPDAAYEVAQNMNSTGNALGIRSTTLGKRLDEQGMLVREPARDELKVRRMLGGQKRRVWQLRPGVLVAGDRDEPVGEDDVEDEDAGVEQTTAYATDAA